MDSLHKKSYSGLIQLSVILGAIIFLPAWTLNYWQGWFYLVAFSLPCVLITVYFLKHDRGLIERRLKSGPAAEKEKSQKIIQSMASIVVVAIVVFSVLDWRFRWSVVPPLLSFVSNVIVIDGFYIVYLVFRENSFTSATIAVAEEQKLITTGPYSVMRHPMYSGAILMFIFTPLALGSFWGLIPGFMLILILFFRTLHEEKFLAKNLPGYDEYCRKVRYRFIPFIW